MSGDYLDYVFELLGPFGTVSARPMFGGHGIFLDGLMFGLVSDDMLYLKSDEMNRIEFEQVGCEMFSYSRKGKRATLGFYRPPDDAMESPELMLPWARTAYAAALRAHSKAGAAALRANANKKQAAAKSAPSPAKKRMTKAKAAPKKPARKLPARPQAAKPRARKAAARR